VRTDVATSAAAVRADARRFQVLRDRALPAAQRAWEATATGYESGKTDILMLLTARKSMVEIEVDIVEARTAIEHALVDLEWAIGGQVRTAPITAVP
jgi:outer membrane protein TolC